MPIAWKLFRQSFDADLPGLEGFPWIAGTLKLGAGGGGIDFSRGTFRLAVCGVRQRRMEWLRNLSPEGPE